MPQFQNGRKYLIVLAIIFFITGTVLLYKMTKPPLTEQSKVPTAKISSVRSDTFIFENKDLRTILKELGDWYKLDVQYKGRISSKTYCGVFSKSDKIEEILDYFHRLTKIQFLIRGNKIIVHQ